MAEKLSEIGSVLGGLGDAVKTLKTVKKNSAELYSITEETKKYSLEVEGIDLPGDSKLNELKEILKNVLESASKVEVWLRNLGDEITKFDRYLRENIKGSSIPDDVLKEFSEKLMKIHNTAKSFSETFDGFVFNLSRAQEVATELEEQQRRKSKEMEEQASSKRNWGTAGSAGLIAASVGLAALGFFTGGAAWVAAAAVGGSVAAGAGVGVGIKTAIDVKAMRQLASGVLSDANKLGVLAKKLKDSSGKAEKIVLYKVALEALQTALEFFQKDLKKDDLIAQQQSVIQDKDERIAELERQLRSMSH